jgi:lipid II:glycine glycyltransferase (peptidoglycan interpeptide bridge formation enzyme)
MEIETSYAMPDYRQKWSDFVFNHPHRTIFQTPEMFLVYKNTKNYKPIAIFAFENETLIGVLTGVIQKEYKGFLGFLSSRYIIFGGPLVKDDDSKIVNILLKEHNRHAKNKAIYTQFRNLFDIKHHKTIFEKNGFNYEPHLNIHIDLTQDIDDFWKGLKSKLRQNIRKAKKNGIIFDEIQTKDELERGYYIIKSVYKFANLPVPDISLFLSSNYYFKNNVKFFKAVYKGEIIGVRIVLLFNHMIYDWYAGSKREYYRYYPNDFLPYKIIEWGLKHSQYNKFDFGGAGKPGVSYGVRDHKLKFSDNLIELGRYEKIHHPVIFKLAKMGFEVWKKMH